MKISVSLPGEDVEFLDAYALEHDLESRSAALQRAIRSLRVAEIAFALGVLGVMAWQTLTAPSPRRPRTRSTPA